MEYSLTQLSRALPVEGRALELRTQFNASLLASIRYLLDACIEVIPAELFSRVVQKLEALEIDLKLSGLLSILHQDFYNAIDCQDVKAINTVVTRLHEDNYYIEKTDIVSFSDLSKYYSPLIQTKFSEIEREVNFCYLSPEEFEKAKSVIKKALSIYKVTFPDFFKEYEELVSEVLILKAEGLKNGSSSDTFGMIYKSSLFNSEKVTDALDFIVHEQAHLYVHLLNQDDPILLNPHERFEAPLRNEKRPLMGIYHATFVLSRMQHVLNEALSRNVLPESEMAYCKEQVIYYKKRFQLGLEILKKHAQMTPLGEMLITSASKLV